MGLRFPTQMHFLQYLSVHLAILQNARALTDFETISGYSSIQIVKRLTKLEQL